MIQPSFMFFQNNDNSFSEEKSRGQIPKQFSSRAIRQGNRVACSAAPVTNLVVLF